MCDFSEDVLSKSFRFEEESLNSSMFMTEPFVLFLDLGVGSEREPERR